MLAFYYGTCEAEFLIRRSPDSARDALATARRTRRHWVTWLFLPDKRKFLDGYISCLEAHLAERERERERGEEARLAASETSVRQDPPAETAPMNLGFR
jgi:hypothetical protein